MKEHVPSPPEARTRVVRGGFDPLSPLFPFLSSPFPLLSSESKVQDTRSIRTLLPPLLTILYTHSGTDRPREKNLHIFSSFTVTVPRNTADEPSRIRPSMFLLVATLTHSPCESGLINELHRPQLPNDQLTTHELPSSLLSVFKERNVWDTLCNAAATSETELPLTEFVHLCWWGLRAWYSTVCAGDLFPPDFPAAFASSPPCQASGTRWSPVFTAWPLIFSTEFCVHMFPSHQFHLTHSLMAICLARFLPRVLQGPSSLAACAILAV